MVEIQLDGVRKTFNSGGTVAVDDIELDIGDGEFLVLVGPSGCGKSTTLRLIAGLETPTSGNVRFDDQIMNNLTAKERDISMVFQNYALYPSMTVWRNMGFGLRMKGVDPELIKSKVGDAAEMMGITELLDRYPDQLSGGQKQRVAIGRAIVREPAVFLLDEPLSSLDARLRSKMRTDIRKLQKQLNITAVYVTHDQEEAMTMGDRIAVMNAGNIEQIGTPGEIYNDPKTLFVAQFIGEPSINMFSMRMEESSLMHENFVMKIPEKLRAEITNHLSGSQILVGVNPEDIVITEQGNGVFNAEIEVIEFIGDRKVIHFYVGDEQRRAIVSDEQSINEGDEVSFDFNHENLNLFSPKGPKIVKWGDVA